MYRNFGGINWKIKSSNRRLAPSIYALMIRYLHLNPLADLPPLVCSEPFAVALVVEAAVSNDWRNAVCDWLAAADCVELAAWGIDCSGWDDAMDWANIAMFWPGDIPEAHFIVTSWYEDVALEEFYAYCKLAPEFSSRPIAHHLLLHIGAESREQELVEAWRESGSAQSG